MAGVWVACQPARPQFSPMGESNKSRKERLAAALRENLRRRKEQSRANSGKDERSAPDDPPGNDSADDG